MERGLGSQQRYPAVRMKMKMKLSLMDADMCII
jgi:hypothetical protein